MSLTIIKAGILDTIQDEGRFGYGALGINPGGVMDVFSARLANCLLGKQMNAPVIEMHFPAPVISFSEAAVMCIAGADFTAVIGSHEIPLNQPVLVNKGSILEFKKVKSGARCYLALLNNLIVLKWLGSNSTNLKAAAGGLHGTALKSGDVIFFENIPALYNHIKDQSCIVLPWKAYPILEGEENKLEVFKGNEWNWLDASNKEIFLNNLYSITKVADRMGYRLSAKPLSLQESKELVSSAVAFGTLQLLPSGQMIVLMADHQTTGGYPRVAHVITAHLPKLAQYKPGDTFSFEITDMETAERKLLNQFNYLQQLQTAAAFKIENLLQ